jgi:hypothetical protein
MLFGVIVFRDRRTWLHRVRHQPVVDQFHGHDIGGLAKGFLDRGVVADMPVVNHITRRFRVKLRRARLQRRANVGDDRQFLVVDHHGFGRVLGLVLGFGDHDRDRLADEAHGLRRHRRPRAHLHPGAVLGGDGPAADQIADLVVDDLLSC